MKPSGWWTTIVLVLVCAQAWAQEGFGRKAPAVTALAPPTVTINRGTQGNVDLAFRIPHGYHINSNQPKAEYLIPTTLKLDAPTDIVVGRITYPDGDDASFPFAPNEKLSVYGGDFTLSVMVRPLASVLPGKYVLRGNLRYQACDNAACYPPKQLPVQFEVKIAKPVKSTRNPAQSPHAHK